MTIYFVDSCHIECGALLVRQFEKTKTFVNVSLDMDEYRKLKNKNKD